jgi:branched-chain amino acid transport system ATP-binding protein
MLLAARTGEVTPSRWMDKARLEWIFGLFPALRKFWLYPAGKLSGGQKQMLAVARAIVEQRALILIVDEPSKGLAPSIIQNLISAFQRAQAPAARRSCSSSRTSRWRARWATRVAVMDNGVVVHAGAMQAFAQDESLQTSLLGLAL